MQRQPLKKKSRSEGPGKNPQINEKSYKESVFFRHCHGTEIFQFSILPFLDKRSVVSLISTEKAAYQYYRDVRPYSLTNLIQFDIRPSATIQKFITKSFTPVLIRNSQWNINTYLYHSYDNLDSVFFRAMTNIVLTHVCFLHFNWKAILPKNIKHLLIEHDSYKYDELHRKRVIWPDLIESIGIIGGVLDSNMFFPLSLSCLSLNGCVVATDDIFSLASMVPQLVELDIFNLTSNLNQFIQHLPSTLTRLNLRSTSKKIIHPILLPNSLIHLTISGKLTTNNTIFPSQLQTLVLFGFFNFINQPFQLPISLRELTIHYQFDSFPLSKSVLKSLINLQKLNVAFPVIRLEDMLPRSLQILIYIPNRQVYHAPFIFLNGFLINNHNISHDHIRVLLSKALDQYNLDASLKRYLHDVCERIYYETEPTLGFMTEATDTEKTGLSEKHTGIVVQTVSTVQEYMKQHKLRVL